MYLLDTNVLLKYPSAISNFDGEIVLSIRVIEEIDGLKNEWLDHKTPFKVKVAAKDLYIRAGAGTSYKKVKENGSYYIKPGVYTIIAVKEGGDYAWGKLKSSTEKKPKWIALDYTTFIG